MSTVSRGKFGSNEENSQETCKTHSPPNACTFPRHCIGTWLVLVARLGIAFAVLFCQPFGSCSNQSSFSTSYPRPSNWRNLVACYPPYRRLFMLNMHEHRVQANKAGMWPSFLCKVCLSDAFLTHPSWFPLSLRCLVKMQKRGQGDCPMCRAPTVLAADRCTSLCNSILYYWLLIVVDFS